jgi:hypothetical protein
MYLLKLLHASGIVIHWIEEAHRNRNLVKLKTQLEDVGMSVEPRVADGPQLLFCCMKSELKLKYPPVMIVMAVEDANTPYSAYLNGVSDVKRIGHYTMSWVFNRAGTKQMIEDGFNVDRLSKTFEDRG